MKKAAIKEHTHPPIKGCLVPDEMMADWQNCPVCWPEGDYETVGDK